MRIGLFGGTFDPPHLGHMILAAEAQYQLALDQLLFILTPDPPHKMNTSVTSIDYRLMMIDAVIGSHPVFELSRVELDRAGPHYAVDTVQLLQAQYPDSELIYLMGADSVMDLFDWERAKDFVGSCAEIGVMKRPETDINVPYLEAQLPGITQKIKIVNAPLLEIASRQIRQRVTEGRPYHFYVLPEVRKVIEERNLYKQEK